MEALALPQRPATTGGSRPLAVLGGAPPSRQGTARLGTAPRAVTGSRSAKGPEVQLSALAIQLIKKLRAKFGDAAADPKSQEIITQEVLAFIGRAKHSRIREEDVQGVQDRIRARLTGGRELKNTLAAEIRARVEADDWARMFEYNIAEGHAKDRHQAEVLRQRQLELCATLDCQREEQARNRKEEAERNIVAFRQEQASFQAWQAEEEAKRQLQADIIERLKEEREVQITERRVRRELALERRRQDEAAAAARIAYETRTEFEREEAARLTAKGALKDFLLTNEVNKRAREQAKLRSWEEDQMFKKKWEEILDKQARERSSRLERLQVIQTQQEVIAKTRPEAKRWLPQEIIDRHYKEREDAREADEQARVQKIKDTAKRLVSTLAEQVAQREAARAAAKLVEEEKARALLARIAADEARETARQAEASARKLRFRKELEDQMRENAHRRRVAPMSSTEKLINAGLLGKVQAFESSGRVVVN